MLSREKILQLLEQGHITAEEAIALLKQLDDSISHTEETEFTKSTQNISKEAEESARRAVADDDVSSFDFNDFLKQGTRIVGDIFNTLKESVETVKNTVETQEYINITGKKAQSDVMNLTDEIEELEFDIAQGFIKIIESNEVFKPTLRVEAVPLSGKIEEKAYYQIQQQDNKLMIKSHHNFVKTKIEVLCPKNTSFTKLKLNALYGSLFVEGIGVKTLNLETTGGKISVNKVTAEIAQLSSVHGYIRYTNSLVGHLNLTSVNGLIYTNVVAENIHNKTTNGRIELSVYPQSKSVQAQTTMGQIVANIVPQVIFNATAKTKFGTIDSMDDAQYTKLSNKSGKMSTLMMVPKDKNANTAIDLETVCGQIVLKYSK